MQISSRLSLAAFLAARTYGSVILTNIPQPSLFLPRNTVIRHAIINESYEKEESSPVSTRAFPSAFEFVGLFAYIKARESMTRTMKRNSKRNLCSLRQLQRYVPGTGFCYVARRNVYAR